MGKEKNSTKQKQHKERTEIFQPKILQPKKKVFQQAKLYKNVFILNQQFTCKNRKNLIPLLSKIDDLPKKTH